MSLPLQNELIASTDIGTLIVRSPDFRQNEPHLAGTGVSVKRIVGWYQMGATPEEIAADYDHLSLAQVYAALTYYFANRSEIDALLLEEEELYESLSQQNFPMAKSAEAMHNRMEFLSNWG